jgi:hypothetical protein
MNKAITMWKTSCVFSLLIAVTGCDTPEDEVVAGDTSEGYDEAAPAELTEDCKLRGDVFENKFCESGWPGHRVCTWNFGDGRPINEAMLFVGRKAHDGSGAMWVNHHVTGGNILTVEVTMPEGDAFNPNAHIALITVLFDYL